jgi:hypothetical protein
VRSSLHTPICRLTILPFLTLCPNAGPAHERQSHSRIETVKSLYELSQKRGGVALRARLKHIDDRLIWFGFVRLTDHASKFGISQVQGKIDLQSYRNLSDTPPPERKPGPAASGRVGTYERPEQFTPLFDTPGTLDDLVWTRLPDASTSHGSPLLRDRSCRTTYGPSWQQLNCAKVASSVTNR